MQYRNEITIELPRDKVIELFDSVDNLYKWQKGLKSFEHVSGDAGEVGAKSKLKFEMGKRKMEMVETITEKNFPDRFSGTYETKGVFNTVENTFVDDGTSRTRWISDCDFKFDSILMKMMGFFFKGAFAKQSMAFMTAFKDFAERGVDVRESA